jgi:hypothetical protein
MWSTRCEKLSAGQILKFNVDWKSSPLPFAEVLRLWQNDGGFRTFFNSLLSDAPFSAFRWETPPLTATSSVQRAFEFVLLDSPGLGKEPDPHAFAEHFARARQEESVVSFPNLGKDAVLVVPRPDGPLSAYGHLAAFVREAPQEQIHSLWKLVGKVMEGQLVPEPLWLSTAGAGVPWLHVRLDKKPKYYGYGPYRDPP